VVQLHNAVDQTSFRKVAHSLVLAPQMSNVHYPFTVIHTQKSSNTVYAAGFTAFVLTTCAQQCLMRYRLVLVLVLLVTTQSQCPWGDVAVLLLPFTRLC
jgi:hypothetical protein